jgi:xanthine dehydrogenase accessory factor
MTLSKALVKAIVTSIEQRESLAVLSVTAGTGRFASQVGHHAVLWLAEERPPIGDLELHELTEPVWHDARRALLDRTHRHVDYTTDQGTVQIFIEVQVQPPHLIIVGAGHIAVPLAAIAKINDFAVTVLDDRPQFAHPARFPTADRVIAGDFRTELRTLRGGKPTFDNHTYLVLVTRGHQYDIDSLLEVLDDPLAYIGMIGSQRRIRAVFELLEREEHIPPQKFDRVYAPIGIDIGAHTPAEIAVCIMAEIINVLRKGPALSMSEQIKRERQERRERVRRRTS